MVPLDMLQQKDHTFGEVPGSREQTHHQPPGWPHAEEVAGVHPYAYVEQLPGRLLIPVHGGNSQNRVPSSLDFEPIDQTLRLGDEQSIKLPQILLDTLPNLSLDVLASSKPNRQRPLHRRIHRKIGIGDHFESLHGLMRTRAAGRQPRRLHLRQSAYLADSADDKYQDTKISRDEAGSVSHRPVFGRVERIVQEHLVDDERQSMVAA